MIVCHCRAVNHTAVLDAIEGGAADVDLVASVCGAGSVCGGCRPTVEALLTAAERTPAVVLAVPMPRARRTRGSSRAGTAAPVASV